MSRRGIASTQKIYKPYVKSISSYFITKKGEFAFKNTKKTLLTLSLVFGLASIRLYFQEMFVLSGVPTVSYVNSYGLTGVKHHCVNLVMSAINDSF